MTSELQVLKKIWEKEGKSCLKLLSSQAEFDIDYIRYLCNCLSKKGQIKPIKGKRDWYRITAKGKKELEFKHLIRPIIKPKVAKKIEETEKVIYYSPKKLFVPKLKVDDRRSGKKAKPTLTRRRQRHRRQKKVKKVIYHFPKKLKAPKAKPEVSIKSPKGSSIKAEEKKMNVWRSIAKAVSFLKMLPKEG